MADSKNIPAALNRLRTLLIGMGYDCEVIDANDLFIFSAYTFTDSGRKISININVTENGENLLIGDGNYVAFEVFIPCEVETNEDEYSLYCYIMQLITHVDMTTIQYVEQTQQILISRVDCIADELPDRFIIDHILTPTIREFLHIFYLIENTKEPISTLPKQYLN